MSSPSVAIPRRKRVDPVVAAGPAARSVPPWNRWLRWLQVGGAGVGVAGVVTALRLSGVLAGVAALVLAAFLVVATPTARSLSQRLVVSGAALAAAVPALWWVELPVPGLRATVLLALSAGTLAGYLASTGRRGMRTLLPSTAAVDGVPLLAALAGLWVLRPWFTVRTAAGALQMLLTGWDWSAHTAMALGVRSRGGTVDVWTAQTTGETWKFTEYPQGFHTTVASLVELWHPRPGAPGGELLLTAHAFGAVALLGTVLVVAALCALPSLRRRPGLALVSGSVVVAAMLLGPGAITHAEGFPNFVFAAALAACVPVMATWRDPAHRGRVLVCLVALVVAAAQAWILLAVAVAPAVVLHLGRAWLRARRGSPEVPHWLLWSALAALVLGVGRAALQVLGSLSVADTLVVDGGIALPDRREVVLLILPALALSILAWLNGAGTPRLRGLDRLDDAAPLLGLGGVLTVAVGVGTIQVAHGSHLGYYFWKVVVASSILAVPLAAVALATLVAAAPPRPPRDRAARAMAVALSAVAASQAFGLTVGGLSLAPGMTARTAYFAAQASVSTTSHELAAATLGVTPAGAPVADMTHVTYLAPVADGGAALSAQQWYLALTGSWTVEANARSVVLNRTVDVSSPYVDRARAVLAADPLARVLVAPTAVDALRAALGPERAARVSTWTVPESGSAATASR